MLRLRTLAVVVVALTVAGAVVITGEEPAVERSAVPTASAPTTTTIQFGETTVVVASGVAAIPLDDQELEATEEALSRATTTTTTTPETTTTVTDESSTTAGSTSSPPPTTATTRPPATTTTTAPAPTTTQPSGSYGASEEAGFASSINSLRSSDGLTPLSRNSSLDSYARSWAQQMARNGSISHSNFGSLLGPWSAVGENVGAGGSVSAVFNALAGSSGHRSNMLGDFTHMGVGVWVDSGGTLWTVHVFAR